MYIQCIAKKCGNRLLKVARVSCFREIDKENFSWNCSVFGEEEKRREEERGGERKGGQSHGQRQTGIPSLSYLRLPTLTTSHAQALQEHEHQYPAAFPVT